MAKNKKFRGLIIAAASICCVALILGVFLLVWFNADSYKDFEGFSQQFEIPGLDDGVVPQGLGNYENKFFISNYMVDGSASRVYVVDGSDQEKYVTFEYDGKTYTGHCGGVAANGKYLWICSGNYIYTADYSDVISTASEQGGVVTLNTRTNVEVNAAFLFYTNGKLFVGEFYREQNYQTDESHHLTTPCGDKNNALALMYLIDSSEDGFEDAPLFAVSITDRIQGFAVVDGKICLSQSYGLSNSHILVYDYVYNITNERKDSITIAGEDVTLYYLDSECLINDYEIPSMSEGLCVYDGEVYVLFESAGKKYRRYVRERIYNVFSFTPAAAE